MYNVLDDSALNLSEINVNMNVSPIEFAPNLLIDSVYRCCDDFTFSQSLRSSYDEHASPNFFELTNLCVCQVGPNTIIDHASDSFLTQPPIPTQPTIQCQLYRLNDIYSLHLNSQQPQLTEFKQMLVNNQHNWSSLLPTTHALLNQTSLILDLTINQLLKCMREQFINNGQNLLLLTAEYYTTLSGGYYLISSNISPLAKLHTNLGSNKFRLVTIANNHEIAYIKYSRMYPHLSNSPYQQLVLLPNANYNINQSNKSLYQQYKTELNVDITNCTIDTYQNIIPKYDSKLGYHIKFDNRRIKMISSKNFKLTQTSRDLPKSESKFESESKSLLTPLQFGRYYANHEFAMDYSYPLSPLVAFAISLAAIDSKWIL